MKKDKNDLFKWNDAIRELAERNKEIIENNKKNTVEYRGFLIEKDELSEVKQYRCGHYFAPRKKDIKLHIDLLLGIKEKNDLELSLLKKAD